MCALIFLAVACGPHLDLPLLALPSFPGLSGLEGHSSFVLCSVFMVYAPSSMYHMLLPPQLDVIPNSEPVLVGLALVLYLEQVPLEGTCSLYDLVSRIRSKSSRAPHIISFESSHSDETVIVGAL